MMLGDMLAAARHSAPGVDRWLGRADPALAASLASTAAAEGVSTAGFVRIAVADFGRYATEEDWATLVSRLRDDAAPGATCLVAMLRWRLAAGDPRPTPGPAPDPDPARGANR